MRRVRRSVWPCWRMCLRRFSNDHTATIPDLPRTGGILIPLLAEITLFGVLPIAFALWQIHDVRREQRKRRETREREEGGES